MKPRSNLWDHDVCGLQSIGTLFFQILWKLIQSIGSKSFISPTFKIANTLLRSIFGGILNISCYTFSPTRKHTMTSWHVEKFNTCMIYMKISTCKRNWTVRFKPCRGNHASSSLWQNKITRSLVIMWQNVFMNEYPHPHFVD